MRDNARFWTFIHGSPVKLTLREGGSVVWELSGRTDEGWRSEWETWRLRDGVVEHEHGADERDCDGRFERTGDASCPIHKLHDGYVLGDGITFPKWEQGDSSQRDHSAEAAGY